MKQNRIILVFLLILILTSLSVNAKPNPQSEDPLSERGIINADRTKLERAYQVEKELMARFHANGYKSDNLKRRDFQSKKDYRFYRQLRMEIMYARKDIVAAKRAFEKTEKMIAAFRKSFPCEFQRMSTLEYRDRFNVAHPLTIMVNTGFLSIGMDEGQTSFNLTDNNEIYCFDIDGKLLSHTVRITLGLAAKKDEIFAHELGHVYGLATAPRTYYSNLVHLSCDFSCQENMRHFIAAPAIKMQLAARSTNNSMRLVK